MSNSQQQVNAMYQAFVDRNDPEKALSEWYNNVKQNQQHKTSIGLKMSMYMYDDMVDFARFFAQRIKGTSTPLQAVENLREGGVI